MGNEVSGIGKCCSSEEIDEVRKKDQAQTLDFESKTAGEST